MNLAGATWRKSSYSGTETSCVELAVSVEHTAVRDSKAPDGGELVLPRAVGTAMLRAVVESFQVH